MISSIFGNKQYLPKNIKQFLTLNKHSNYCQNGQTLYNGGHRGHELHELGRLIATTCAYLESLCNFLSNSSNKSTTYRSCYEFLIIITHKVLAYKKLAVNVVKHFWGNLAHLVEFRYHTWKLPNRIRLSLLFLDLNKNDIGWEPWSSGYGRWLMIERLWVRIP